MNNFRVCLRQVQEEEIRCGGWILRCSELQFGFVRDPGLIAGGQRFTVEFQIAADHENVGAPSLRKLVRGGLSRREKWCVNFRVLMNLHRSRNTCPSWIWRKLVKLMICFRTRNHWSYKIRWNWFIMLEKVSHKVFLRSLCSGVELLMKFLKQNCSAFLLCYIFLILFWDLTKYCFSMLF